MSSTFQKLMVALVLAALSIQPAAACAACYGEPDAPMSRGLTWAILALCAVVGVVLSGVVAFFVHIGHRSVEASRIEGRDDVSNSRR